MRRIQAFKHVRIKARRCASKNLAAFSDLFDIIRKKHLKELITIKSFPDSIFFLDKTYLSIFIYF